MADFNYLLYIKYKSIGNVNHENKYDFRYHSKGEDLSHAGPDDLLVLLVRYCEDLEQAGALSPKTKRRFQAFTVEVQAEINTQVIERIDRMESDDWHTSGQVREKWEKYLRGPEPKPPGKGPKQY